MGGETGLRSRPMPAIPVYRDPVGEVILVGTSLSPESDAVVRAAAAVADAVGAGLHIAHFLPSPELPPRIGEALPAPLLPGVEERERDAVEGLLAQVERTGIGERICGTTVTDGVAHRLLSRMAESLDASLVVVGARESGGAVSRLLGSTAERVVRSGAAPVLVVRGELPMPPSALVTVDLSPGSVAAFGAGLRWLARVAATEVTALFVVSPFQARVGSEEVDYETAVGAARSELARLCEERGGALPRPAEPVVRRGVPRVLILEEASRRGSDLVLVGSHGRSGYQRFLLGSVSEEVVRHAETSVLVLPAVDPEER